MPESKELRRAGRRRWYLKYRERIIAKSAAYRLAHPDRSKEEARLRHRRATDAEFVARERAYRDSRRAKDAAYALAYYQANKEGLLAYSRARYHADPESARLKQYARNRANPEAAKRTAAKTAMKRRAAKAGAVIGPVELQRILDRDGAWCYLCRCDIADRKQLTFDHVIPLTRGGTHTEENLRPAHRRCNSSKSNSTPSEYFARGGFGGHDVALGGAQRWQLER